MSTRSAESGLARGKRKSMTRKQAGAASAPLQTGSNNGRAHRAFGHIRQFLRRQAILLHQKSVIRRFTGIDDRVDPLHQKPLGMFFYNLRAVFFAASGLFLAPLIAVANLLNAPPYLLSSFHLLGVYWALGVVITLVLHPVFVRRLSKWGLSAVEDEFPPLFELYFALDFFLVLALLVTGYILKLPVGVVVMLMVANVVVYSACVGAGRGIDKIAIGLLALAVLLAFFSLSAADVQIGVKTWLDSLLLFGALAGMLFVTVVSVAMVSWLRAKEHQITKKQLEMLGEYENILSEAHSGVGFFAGKVRYSQDASHERVFRERVTEVLRRLCSLGAPFWYRSSCIWFVEEHQDRKYVLLPGPRFNFSEAREHKVGLEGDIGLLGVKKIQLIPSLVRFDQEGIPKLNPDEALLGKPIFRSDLDAPAAFVPLMRHGRRLGVLAIYGEPGGPPILTQERQFLRSLSSIIVDTMEQWEGRYRRLAHSEMDSLLACNSLEDVFTRAASILKKHLSAKACMVVFRRTPDGPMKVVAVEGVRSSMLGQEYSRAGSQTSRSADLGEVVRVDDVPRHRHDFDQEMLRRLEDAYGAQVSSWMAVPIGPKGDNYGVIKVINSEFRCPWFTKEDEHLGQELALRLHVLIQKFMHVEGFRDAKALAERNARQALAAQEKAEESAHDRQVDLLSITHQLQGPLITVIGALSWFQLESLPRSISELLDNAQALAEDALLLCHGTSMSFSLEAGKRSTLGQDEINAAEELELLTQRLVRSNARQDLKFRFMQADGFPLIRMDRQVFVNVVYSLIHNAMKYADENSEVDLDCGFEGQRPALKVRSLGEPILPAEKEAVFGKFKRGAAVRRTGRHHAGSGLGLWIARQLMRSVDGDLVLELSDAHPRLSIFVVYPPGFR